MLRAAGILVVAALSALSLEGQAPIRSGVELVAVDVHVVDPDGQPIAGLKPADFEVFIDGRRRDVLSAELVRYGSESATATASTPGSATASTARPRRMFIIAVDEHSVRIGAARAATEAARRFIDRLGPDDLVGLFAYPTGTAQLDLTTDHAAVRAGLDRINGLFEHPATRYALSPSEVIDIASGDRDALARIAARECRADAYCRKDLPLEAQSLAIMFEMKIAQSLGGLRGLVEGLASVPGRKTLVLVSGGLLVSDRADGRVSARSEMSAIGRAAAAANTTLYALHMDSSFLDAFSPDGKMSSTLFRDSSMFATGLEMVAGAAGGDVMRIEGGTPDRAFDRVLRETSAHYLLGVEVRAADRDGRAHNIRVAVKRRGAVVRSRTMVMIPGAADVLRKAEELSSAPPPVRPPVDPAPARAPDPPGLPDGTPLGEILRRAARFLAQFEREVSAVVSEEQYTQRAGGGSAPFETRRLRADLLAIADEDLGWIGFRDVFEVDGGRVRDRDQRLADLFLKPNADRLAQARRIAAESSRFNLNSGRYEVQRTINIPMTALRFLRASNQPRSAFTFEGPKRIDGIDTSLISFEERAEPRMIASPDGAAARGRFWIDATGRVVRSELSFETAVGAGIPGTRSPRERVHVRSTIKVSYGEEPRSTLWMPMSMDEQYSVEGTLLEGRGTYSNFRRFSVETVVK